MKNSQFITFDRIMTALILVLQLTIVAMIWHAGKTNPDKVHPGTQLIVERQQASAFHDDPWMPKSANDMRKRMNHMMQHALSEFEVLDSWMAFDEGWNSLLPSPTMDMREGEHNYVVIFSMPGATLSDFQVKLHGRLLTVSSHDSLLNTGSHIYERRIWLPGPVGNHEKPQAVMTNGVLKVVLPKAKDQDSQQRQQTLDIL
ncbi:MAG: Hsp20/alpha crystallin family protein [Lentisphaerae bacterium]|nr:Hsp20/alpha crystallin family protein [Lentisphaerota bacterium]